MGRNNYFQFKQFRIVQEKSAMKVGIDGVLLGAWADVSFVNSVLDIGTGTGLIALIIAQKSNAKITAVEIEKNSFDEACYNVSQSRWREKISLFHTSFQEYSKNSTNKFDLIISNPPFFENSKRAANPIRSNARHNDLLPFEELISGSLNLMEEKSRLALILPVAEAEKFIQIAHKKNLFLIRHTKVKPTLNKPPHRYLMEFSKNRQSTIVDEFSIEIDKPFDFSEEYIELTKDFYLKF